MRENALKSADKETVWAELMSKWGNLSPDAKNLEKMFGF